MNPALRLCEHLACEARPALSVRPDDVLDWWDGPVLGVVRCDRCDGAALLELLAWCDGRYPRAFALSAVERSAVALHARDAARGSCDLSRAARELEALVASCGPPERLVALDADGRVLRGAPWPADATLPNGSALDRVRRADAARWFAALALPASG